MARLAEALQSSFIGCIRIYQACISCLLGSCCRFEPNCSEYALRSISTLGLGRGVYLSLRRMLRCHPWHCGGEDPVPSK